MSSRQLATTVVEGRMVTFHFLSDALDPIEGYLCGMDDFHWMVVTPLNEKHLIHKSAARVDLHSESTYGDEDMYSYLEEVVSPFRDFVERTGLARSKGSSSASTERAVPA
jgi:hypothetical protein